MHALLVSHLCGVSPTVFHSCACTSHPSPYPNPTCFTVHAMQQETNHNIWGLAGGVIILSPCFVSLLITRCGMSVGSVSMEHDSMSNHCEYSARAVIVISLSVVLHAQA